MSGGILIRWIGVTIAVYAAFGGFPDTPAIALLALGYGLGMPTKRTAA